MIFRSTSYETLDIGFAIQLDPQGLCCVQLGGEAESGRLKLVIKVWDSRAGLNPRLLTPPEKGVAAG